METTLDLSRWREKPLGIVHRRWVITSTGLRQLLGTRFFRILLILAWTAGLLMAAAGFLFTQSIAEGGWLETLALKGGPRFQAIVSAFTGLIALYPDIVIGGLFTAEFWWHSWIGLTLSLVALTAVVPRLITSDRASNALTIYLSRPLTSLDYLIGKLGIIVGVLVLMWTGPLLFGWVLSMLFAPDSDFFTYSLAPLAHAGVFNLIGLIVLAAVALGVSSLTRSSRNTILLWIGVWIIAFVIASFETSPAWMRRVSFQHDLNQVRSAVFKLDEALLNAADTLPLIDRKLTDGLRNESADFKAEGLTGALTGLALITTLSCFVFFRRMRPE